MDGATIAVAAIVTPLAVAQIITVAMLRQSMLDMKDMCHERHAKIDERLKELAKK